MWAASTYRGLPQQNDVATTVGGPRKVPVVVVQCLLDTTQRPSPQPCLTSRAYYGLTQWPVPLSYIRLGDVAACAAPTRFYSGRQSGSTGKGNDQPVGEVTAEGAGHDT